MKKTSLKKAPKKILGREHTGKIRHHQHTSYGSLAVLLVMAFVTVFSASRAIASAATIDPTQEPSSSYKTYAVVAGQAPKTAPTMLAPTAGQTYTTSDPIVVRGSCPNNTLVKVFKDGVLAGSALCQNGSYQLSIDLFVGNNSLIARAYNANDVASPDSAPISVLLVLPGTNLNGTEQLNTQGAPAGQFYVTSEVFHRGGSVGDSMSWPIILAGGQSPYAVSVSWGDGKTDLFSRGDASRFMISHVYSKAAGDKGSYVVVVKATDQQGAQSYIQLAAIVGGGSQSVGVIGSVTGGSSHSNVIRFAWQGLLLAAIIVFSFWLGEKRELRELRRGTLKRA